MTLFLMTKKGLAVLQALIDNDMTSMVDMVVGARDRSIQKDYYEEIRELCKSNEIGFWDKKNVLNTNSKYAIAVSWRWLIELPHTELIIFHDSLLPKYRGFNPLVSCLLNKEKEIGVTALFATEEFDKGDIIQRSATKITHPIKLYEAVELITKNYQTLAIDIVTKIKNGESLNAIPQIEEQASYSVWRDEKDYRIDWTKDAEYISRFVKALGMPYNGASSLMDGKLVRVLAATSIDDVIIENRHAGKLLFKHGDHPVVICGHQNGYGLLRITSMIDEKGIELLPLKKYRVRFE